MKLFRKKSQEEKQSRLIKLRGYGRNQRRYAKQKLEKLFIQAHRAKMAIDAKAPPIPTALVIADMIKCKAAKKVTMKSAKKSVCKARQKAICIQKGVWGKKPDPRNHAVVVTA